MRINEIYVGGQFDTQELLQKYLGLQCTMLI